MKTDRKYTLDRDGDGLTELERKTLGLFTARPSNALVAEHLKVEEDRVAQTVALSSGDSTLTALDRRILKAFVTPPSLAQVAAQLQVSKQRVSEIADSLVRKDKLTKGDGGKLFPPAPPTH